MADFSLPAPDEPQKPDFLHNRPTRPPRSAVSAREIFERFWGYGLGVVFAILLTSTMFQVRASWENPREWLVMFIPFFAIAGLAFGIFLQRGQWTALAVPAAFLFLTGIFTVSDLLADIESASARARQIVSILGGISLGLTTLTAIIALIWVEVRNPPKAPQQP
jgi:hypothetical protein